MFLERSDKMNKCPIGIFDSGIGGISILNAVRKILPNEDYIYYGDSLNNPYGNKSKEELMELVCHIVEDFIEKKCKLIVVACNTATTVLIKDLRCKYPDIIFVGTEPAIKVAYDYHRDEKVLVMATPGTIKSEKLSNLSDKYYQKNRYFLQCDKLANLIENRSNDIDLYLDQLLEAFKDKHIDVVVLGCTHYPFIKDKIAKILDEAIFIDGGVGIANRVNSILTEKKWLNDSPVKGKVTLNNSLENKLDFMMELLEE